MKIQLQLDPNQPPIPAESINFIQEIGKGTILQLENGMVIHCKLLITQALFIPNHYDPQGNPVIYTNYQVVSTVVECPEKLKKPPTTIPTPRVT